MSLCFLGDVARIAGVTLTSERVLDIAQQGHRRKARERLHDRRARVWNQQHVAEIDGLKAADRRAVEAEALFERVAGQTMKRHRGVLPLADQVDELEVDHDRFVLLTQLYGFF